MINIRKILLLSALLMSVSSITFPTYAMDQDKEEEITHLPRELTQTMLEEVDKEGGFSTVRGKKYILTGYEHNGLLNTLQKFVIYTKENKAEIDTQSFEQRNDGSFVYILNQKISVFHCDSDDEDGTPAEPYFTPAEIEFARLTFKQGIAGSERNHHLFTH